MLSLKISIFYAKFCMIPWSRIRDRTTTTISEKTEYQSSLLRYMYPNCIMVISNDAYFAYKFFPISSTRNRDQCISKISEKVKLQCHLLSDLHQKLIETNSRLNNTEYKIS